MQPNPRFLYQPMTFWAAVRSVSQKVGYTERGRSGQIRVPSVQEIRSAYSDLGLETTYLFDSAGVYTEIGKLLFGYFTYRADVLNQMVSVLLMDADEAKERLAALISSSRSRRALVMNKQTGAKAGPSPLTNTVNLLIEVALQGESCDYDPRQLTTFTRRGVPVRTLARRVDGAYPSTVNPIAIWEIKEYYHTTTFGSRVADGVYETLLDGLELEELRRQEKIECKHYLFVDSHNTWWNMGRPYLCRIVDMLHMGYVDEVMFGREVYERLPVLVPEWRGIQASRRREASPLASGDVTDSR